jgi:hypothetical protein
LPFVAELLRREVTAFHRRNSVRRCRLDQTEVRSLSCFLRDATPILKNILQVDLTSVGADGKLFAPDFLITCPGGDIPENLELMARSIHCRLAWQNYNTLPIFAFLFRC